MMEAFSGFMGQLPVQCQAAGWEHHMIAARPSDDDQSINSDGTEVLASCSGFAARAVHRGRKGIPHRAPMYGTNDASADESPQAPCPHKACSKPSRPDRQPLSSSSTGAAAAPAAAAKPSSIAAGSKGMKKTANPQQGPCNNCGTYVSPQWRHGSKSKPTVCNACGIRYLRTGSFNKVQDKRRPGTFAAGGRQPKRSRGDKDRTSTEPEEDEHDQPHIAASHHQPDFHPVSSRHAAAAAARSRSSTPPAGAAPGHMVSTVGGHAGTLPGGDWLQAAAAAAQQQLPAPGSNYALMPPPQQVGKQQQQQQYNSQQQYCSSQQYSQALPLLLPRLQSLSPAESPASTGTAYNPGSTPPSPLALDGAPVSSFQGAVSSSAAAAHNTAGVASTEAAPPQQQQQQQQHVQVQQQRGHVAAGGRGPSRLGAAGSSSRPMRFGATAQAAAMGTGSTSSAMVLPAGLPAAAAAASRAPAEGMVPSADLLQLVARLAGTLGSVEAAIAFIKNLHSKQESLPGSAAGAGAAGGAAAAAAAGMQSLGGV